MSSQENLNELSATDDSNTQVPAPLIPQHSQSSVGSASVVALSLLQRHRKKSKSIAANADTSINIPTGSPDSTSYISSKLPMKPSSAHTTFGLSDIEVVTPLGLEEAHGSPTSTTLPSAPATIQSLPQQILSSNDQEKPVPKSRAMSITNDVHDERTPLISIHEEPSLKPDGTKEAPQLYPNKSPTLFPHNLKGDSSTRATTPMFGGLGPTATSQTNTNNHNNMPSIASISALDSLLINSKAERETAINFLKLDEYLEGLSMAAKSPKQSHQRRGSATKKSSNERFTYYSAEYGKIVGESMQDLNSGDGMYNISSLLRAQYFWIDICDPSADEMKLFASIFNIHPLTMEDVMTDSTREKFELYKNYYFICYCAFDQDPESAYFMQSFNIYILVYSTFVLTFHYYPCISIDQTIRRLEHLKSYLKVTPHWINYALLDDVTDKYLPLIHSIELEVDSIDDLVLVISQTEQSDMLRRIANARRRVMNLQRLLVAKSDVLRVLIKRLDGMANGIAGNMTQMVETSAAMLRDTALYLGDVQDHVITMVQTLAHVDTTLNRCHSNYLAQINIELTSTSNAANDAVAKLTAIASILVPLNIITGLWGMNVHVPGQSTGAANEGFSWFIGIVLSLIIIVLGGLASLKFMGLLDGKKTRRRSGTK